MPLEVLTDKSGLLEISRKVERGERLTADDGMALYKTPNVAALSQLADFANQRLNGLRVGYNVNRHINYSNVCKLSCMFCAYAKKHGEDGAYEFSMDEIIARAKEAYDGGADEIHIVGGLQPDYPWEYYPAMLRAIKTRYPELHLKAFTAVEIDYFANLAGKTHAEVLHELVDAGLGSMPGGGAEILTDRVWSKLYRDKMGPDMWIKVHRIAHQCGVRSNSTMLHGHIERDDEKITHMLRIRELQDETGGFMTFIPLRFHPENTPIQKLGIVHGVSSVREIAIGRLLLDNVPHVKTYWIMTSLEVAQICLTAGADDIDGTVVEEKITHMAGAKTPEHVSEADLRRVIEEAGRTPVRRDTLYNELPYPPKPRPQRA
ncbi:MAG: aminofutalosine synthase MqnE [Planctomycetes bacterium]|nr:aminofutalosine synthase MqnE [Planctomycetota bacterium]